MAGEVPKQEPDEQLIVSGRRVAARARVSLEATLETVQGTRRAFLKNISTTGALLEVGSLPTVGAGGVLKCGPIDCFGAIVWARFRWCGFAFDEPIPHEHVLAMRLASDEAAKAPNRAAQEAARRWASGTKAF